MELNREEIIKALECCYMQELEHNENCPECPYTNLYPNCGEYLGKNALTLIKQLTEENEKLKENDMEKHTEICVDNRFELIKKYKEKLVEATNIETAKDEMAVIDNILFRLWQIGWLDKLEADVVPRSECEKWYAEYHKAKEDLKQEKMYHRSTEKLADRYLIELKQAKQEVAREIFEQLEEYLKPAKFIDKSQDFEFGYNIAKIKIKEFIAELKKKYIGE